MAVAPVSPTTLGLSSPSLNALPSLATLGGGSSQSNGGGAEPNPLSTPFVKAADQPLSPSLVARKDAASNGYSQRVVLTTYPGQVGIRPIPLQWGAETAESRGPVVASRQPASLKVRNAIGAYSGSYSIYKALAAAAGLIDPFHRPGKLQFLCSDVLRLKADPRCI